MHVRHDATAEVANRSLLDSSAEVVVLMRVEAVSATQGLYLRLESHCAARLGPRPNGIFVFVD